MRLDQLIRRNLMKILIKDSEKELSDHLNQREVDCSCLYTNCQWTMIHPDLIKAFEGLRKAYKFPIYVSSGFRCQQHNKDVKGTGGSKHTLGLALDLRPFKIEHYDHLFDLALGYFDAVLEYRKFQDPKKWFIHCHLKRWEY